MSGIPTKVDSTLPKATPATDFFGERPSNLVTVHASIAITGTSDYQGGGRKTISIRRPIFAATGKGSSSATSRHAT